MLSARNNQQCYGANSRSKTPHQRPVCKVHAADKLLSATLDKVLNQITRILYEHEQKQRKLGQGSKAVEAEVVGASGKPISFKTGYSSERLVKEPGPGAGGMKPGRGLREYLSLPLSEYSLLDPKWITRPDPVSHPDVFLLKVPLHDMVHVMLEPQVTVKVNIDPHNSKVHFNASAFKIGDERFDSSFTLDMDAVLSCKDVSEVNTLAAAFKGISLPGLGQSTNNIVRNNGPTYTTSHPSTGTVKSERAGSTATTSIDSTMQKQGSDTQVADGGEQHQQAPLPSSQTRQQQPVNNPEETCSTSQAAAVSHHEPSQSQFEVNQSSQSPATTTTCTCHESQQPQQPLCSTSTQSTATTGEGVHTHTHAGTMAEPLPAGSHQSQGVQTLHISNTSGSSPASSSDSISSYTSDDESPDAAHNLKDAGILGCKVDMQFHVAVAAPLSAVPGPMLSLAGSLLARFAVQSMLPGFLELLAVDYGRWASGATRSSNVGSLIKTQQQQQHAAPPATTSHGADMSKVDNADVAVTDVDVSSASVGSAGGAEGQQHQDLHPALQQPFGANTSGRA